jgi:uncharacterized membrane protein YfcA
VAQLVSIGLAGGFLSALFGVGGGIVLVPLLVLWARFQERTAMATSLGAIGVISLAGVAAYGVAGRVHVVEGLLVGVPAAAGAIGGAALQQRVPQRTLSLLFAGLLVAVAGLLLFT